MKKVLLFIQFLFVMQITISQGFSQELNLEDYQKYLEKNQNVDYNSINILYPRNTYFNQARLPCYNGSVQSLSSIKSKIGLTDDEMTLLEKNMFVVLSREKYSNFLQAIVSYYSKDLPLYFTSDAIIYILHKTYDSILLNLESEIIISDLLKLLNGLSQEVPVTSDANIITAYKDANLYIAVAKSLLTGETEFYTENDTKYKTLFNLIISSVKAENYSQLEVLPQTCVRDFDFSQFKIRGHYTFSKELGRYFQAMMWLGRSELYLISPKSDYEVETESLNRQLATAYLITERIKNDSKLQKYYKEINDIICSFVGEQDNVQINHIDELSNEVGISNVDGLFTDNKFEEFRNALSLQPYSDQKILSQILIKSPNDSIKPASSFLLFGSRFVFDSYIFSNLVYDKVHTRLMPKPMDVLFVLGNNSAQEFLKADFEYPEYGRNLSSLRYLVDCYGQDFWTSSVYNSWLYSIKTLNPPHDITKLPVYMQSPAWWQMKMNTQLASWTNLRHDNLLYAKQSYTGGPPYCSFPTATIEPVPEFFGAVSTLFSDLIKKLDIIDNTKSLSKSCYLSEKIIIINKLKDLAQKVSDNIQLSESEIGYLQSIYGTASIGCSFGYSGWYGSDLLNLDFEGYSKMIDEPDIEHLIADVHTQPMDEDGNTVGKILHVGTGFVNTMVVITKETNGYCTAYVAPVYSYYEYISDDFHRLNDNEWQSLLTNSAQIARPIFTKLYLADEEGRMQENAQSLEYILDVDDIKLPSPQAEIAITPNPFISNVDIWLRTDNITSLVEFSADIYDANGILIKI